MCVIIAMESKIPSLDTFKLCAKKNPHGGGISWVKNGKVHWKKGIEAEEVHSIAERHGAPCVAHFRISTVGGTPKSLCHPFPIEKVIPDDIEGKSDAVLFHNGHWKDWDDVCMQMVLQKNAEFHDADWSDSKAMAWIAAHSNHSFLHFVSSQRVVIQTPKTRIYYGTWEQKEDVWYSNLNWVERETKYLNDKEWFARYGKRSGYDVKNGVWYGYDDATGCDLYGNPEDDVPTADKNKTNETK